MNANSQPMLAPMDFAARSRAIRSRLESEDVDVLVVTHPPNVRWLTGFTGSNGQVLVSGQTLTVVTDPRYEVQVAQELAAAGVAATVEIVRPTDDRKLAQIVAGHGQGGARIGLESDSITKAQWDEFTQVMEATAGDGGPSQLVPVSGWVQELRQIKDDGEIARLRYAAAIADQALASVAAGFGPGVTEIEIAAELAYAMRRAGAEDVAFPTIVAAGANAALPHAQPSHRPLADGELLLIDMGARYDGYHSDMTRTFAIGALHDEQANWVEAVLAAQRAGVEAVSAGVSARAIDRRCREVLADFGLADYFTHGTGHSIGLEIHEQPMLSTRSEDILAVGHVVTVEPGVYLPGFGGVRIEDSVLVTPSGREPLTLSPKIDLDGVNGRPFNQQ